MVNWREIKATARRIVHDTFRVSAVYLSAPSALPIRVSVRVHDKAVVRGMGLEGASVEVNDSAPKIVFDHAEIAVTRRNALIVVSSDEIYRLGACDDVLSGFYAVEATRLLPEQAAETVAALTTLNDPAWVGIVT